MGKKMYQRFENTAFISRPCLYKKVKGVGASIPSNGWKTRMTGTRRIIPSLGAKQATLSMYRCISISETICSKIVASSPSRYFPTIRQITCTKAIVLSAPPSPSALASWLPWTLKVVLLLRPKMTGTWRLPSMRPRLPGWIFLPKFSVLGKSLVEGWNPKMDDTRFQKIQ